MLAESPVVIPAWQPAHVGKSFACVACGNATSSEDRVARPSENPAADASVRTTASNARKACAIRRSRVVTAARQAQTGVGASPGRALLAIPIA